MMPTTNDTTLSPARRSVSNRVLITALMAFTLVLYLWNAPNAIDYPQYDESNYFYSGYQLSIGDLNRDWTWSPQASPLIAVFYAVFIALLDTSKVYPWLHTLSLFLVGMGAYFLLSRILRPVISWLLATMVVIASSPAVPENTLYYLSAGLLWISLSLLSKRLVLRGFAAFCVLITVYLRPEFLLCLFVLLVALVIVEGRQLRQKQVTRIVLGLVYAPVIIGLIATLLLWSQTPEFISMRGVNVLPWSYNNFYRDSYPDQFNGFLSYANPYLLFEQDFGAVPERSTTTVVLAMFRNIPKLIEYLRYSASMLWTAYATSLFMGFGWHLPLLANNFLAIPTYEYDVPLGLLAVGLLGLGTAGYRRLRRQNRLQTLAIKMDSPVLMGFIALIPLVVVLMLLIPQLRYFQIFPLVLLPIGCALTVLVTVIRVPRWAVAVGIASVLVFMPHPYIVTGEQVVTSNIALLRRHMQDDDRVLGGAMTSYTHYLRAEGIDVTGIDSASIPEPTIVHAIEDDVALTHIFMNHLFSYETYQRWLNDWNSAYPESPLMLVEQQEYPYSALYQVSSDDTFRARFSYRSFQRQAQALGQDTRLLPPPDVLDFGQRVTWMSDSPNHNLTEEPYNFWDTQVYAFRMSPPYPDIPLNIPTQVYATLPAAWSGRSLIFLATIAPYLLDGRAESDGVIVQMTVQANGQAVTTSRRLDNIDQQNYVVLRLELPPYTGEARVTVAIDARATTWYDLLHITHVGVLR